MGPAATSINDLENSDLGRLWQIYLNAMIKFGIGEFIWQLKQLHTSPVIHFLDCLAYFNSENGSNPIIESIFSILFPRDEVTAGSYCILQNKTSISTHIPSSGRVIETKNKRYNWSTIITKKLVPQLAFYRRPTL